MSSRLGSRLGARSRQGALVALSVSAVLFASTAARAADKLLEEVVGFTGAVLFLDTKVPAMVIGAVRDGQTAVFGFGETSKGSGKTPDGNTMMRIGSITKAFTGQVLAAQVARGSVHFTDRLQDRIGWTVKVPEKDGKPIRLIELATHSSGLPREVERESWPGRRSVPYAHQGDLYQGPAVRPAAVRAGDRAALFQLRLRHAGRSAGQFGEQALRRAAQGDRARSGRAQGHGDDLASRRCGAPDAGP